MIKPGEIQKKANQSKVRDRQIEKDYIITWILFGISQNKLIFNNLVFRGGTALKKAYFPG
jgi:predicted nucleotidyltransferase component of viral defense system